MVIPAWVVNRGGQRGGAPSGGCTASQGCRGRCGRRLAGRRRGRRLRSGRRSAGQDWPRNRDPDPTHHGPGTGADYLGRQHEPLRVRPSTDPDRNPCPGCAGIGHSPGWLRETDSASGGSPGSSWKAVKPKLADQRGERRARAVTTPTSRYDSLRPGGGDQDRHVPLGRFFWFE
ncbi:MAG: hypothetical protein QOI20_3406 [Acidimicrobiaceae bacterium]|nr:hypothetical protein [Acidimicrobiaceae bacterium]